MCGIQISVFMEKATNHSEILEKLLSSRLLNEKNSTKPVESYSRWLVQLTLFENQD